MKAHCLSVSLIAFVSLSQSVLAYYSSSSYHARTSRPPGAVRRSYHGEWSMPLHNGSGPYVCEWFNKKKEVEAILLSINVHLGMMRHELDRRNKLCGRKISKAGPLGQHPAVQKAHKEAGESLVSAVQGMEDAASRCRSFAIKLEARQRSIAPHGVALRNCVNGPVRQRYDPALNLTTLHDHFATAVNELLSIGGRISKNRVHGQSMLSTALRDFEKLREVDTVFARALMGFTLTTKTLTSIKRRKHMLNEKAALSCEIWKRLDVMEATFVALKAFASNVTSMATNTLRTVEALKAKASRHGEKGTGTGGMQSAMKMTSDAMAEASAMLQKLSRGGMPSSLQTLLVHDSEFRHSVSRCRNETRLDSRLQLRHATEEFSSVLYNFSKLEEAVKRLWAGVTNMTDGVHANCNRLESVDCVVALHQLNVLMEESRRSRESVVAKLRSAINLLSTAPEQNVQTRPELSSNAEEAKDVKSNATVPVEQHSQVSNVTEFVSHDVNVSTASAVGDWWSSTTVAIAAAAVSFLAVSLAGAALLMWRRRGKPSKEISPF
ncbi:hypothetical protein ERJ75_000167400 [Trypanosoma vivax]|uniref:Uncharacterized protein n=1 Tax=Trypanosoma vivax (strain Y486) TaxID=1055687 RepID=F9WPB7_TRYVY|nr:hypothetical protein ERJ75_000167400 [Trypanosoma vivax]CCD19393.1 hypothetical protein, conserved in T. vivax [Trypanosoma vivax Y486]|eukprot:CCD19393.1 hypothetical protein, conserved in T. vivax [Trypanosoma vivax Y486]